MDNAIANLNSIRQPNPTIGGQNVVVQNQSNLVQNNPTKTNVPKIGVVEVPTISTTPLADTLTLKKQQTPKIKLKYISKSNRDFNLHNICSFSVIGCAIIALLSLKKKK